jgi:hypothetical protein
MRNFLFAAATAQKKKRAFGVAVVCPKRTSTTLRKQIDAFRKEILREEFADRIRLCFYEDYIRLLRNSGDHDAVALSGFLQGRIDDLIQA